MGLIVSIYRSDYRSPINVFDGVDAVTVVNVEGPFEATPDRPAALLTLNGLGSLILVPVVDGVPMTYVAHGGSFASTSDSRWHDAVKFYGAVPIHDRDMSKERQS